MATKIFLIILALGMFMRIYQYRERFIYAHDHDLAAWIAKDIVVDRHLRLVGQETSSQGIFIGPLYYYLLIPFYLATHMDPIGTVAFPWLVGLATITSLYWIFQKLYGHKTALIGSLLYSGSFLMSITDREVYPTTPVTLWTIWMFYAVNQLFKGEKSGLILSAVLLALVWHLNLALVLIVPVILLGVLWHRRLYSARDFVVPILAFSILSLPLAIFEFRHGFIQTRALLGTFGSSKPQADYLSKLVHVWQYSAKNVNRIFYYGLENIIPSYILPAIIFLSAFYISGKNKIPRFYWLIASLWLFSFIAFFTFHPINLSEYYLNGMNIIWLATSALILSMLPKKFYIPVLIVFVVTNTFLLVNQSINHNGYTEKKSLVKYIASDAASHGYPCVSISYMTDPGYELGYRYWFWLAGLKTAPVNSLAPVYTIVFPHPRANHLDATFGAIGLVHPDYSRYLPQQVKISCSGENSNLTDPMFGFTK